MNEKKATVLIVDDAEINREILAEMLKDDYHILAAENGKEAIEIMEKNYRDIRIVLLDMHMPVLSGEETLLEMRRRLWLDQIPVICISSDETKESIENAYNLGVTDYFTRPFDAAVVGRRVKNAIDLYEKRNNDFMDSMDVLSSFFYRIVKCNLTTGRFLIFRSGNDFEDKEFNSIEDIYELLEKYATMGYVHGEDRSAYLSFCDKNNLTSALKKGKNHLRINYRRNIGGKYRWVTLEFTRSLEYTDDNQVVLMCVQDVNDDYLRKLDVVMRRNQGDLGMVSLNITRGLCIASATPISMLELLDGVERIEHYVERCVEIVNNPEVAVKLREQLSQAHLLSQFAAGFHELDENVAVYLKEDDELHVIHLHLEMVENTISGDVEGILSFRETTNEFLSEQITERLYSKNYCKIFVINASRDSMIVDDPQQFTISNKKHLSCRYSEFVDGLIANYYQVADAERIRKSADIDTICENLDKNGEYHFAVNYIEQGMGNMMQKISFAYLNKKMKVIIGAAEDVTELSRKDTLTAGYNRAGFLAKTQDFLTKIQKKADYAILYFDIRNFKATNDLFGMAFGDRLLKEVYNTLEKSKCQPIVIARIEADQFACLVRKETISLEEINDLCEMRIKENNRDFLIYLQCGIYELEEDVDDVAEMIDMAKIAANAIRDVRTNYYSIYEPDMKTSYVAEAEVMGDLESGILRKELVVYYQPVVDAKTGKIASAEALVRWIHPEKGFISPGVFIPALEKNGHISDLDHFVAEDVWRFLEKGQEEGRPYVPVSVNLSWADFYDDRILNWIMDTLEKSKEKSMKTRIEITETSYTAMGKDRREILEKMRSLGADLLMDDFGSGYSSFGILQDYNFDILKLDMSFVRKIEESEKTRAIIQMIIQMAHALGMRLIAEGAETEEQVNFLRDNGCDYIQGYYFYKPMPEADFVELLKKQV